MKKRTIPLLIGILFCSFLMGGCGAEGQTLQGGEWEMKTVSSMDTGAVIAVSESAKACAPEAPVRSVFCRTENGKIWVSDASTGETWPGEYSRMRNAALFGDFYTVSFGNGEPVQAVVSETVYADGKRAPTLVLSDTQYAVCFQLLPG